jgi:hypothetical protein
VAGRFTCPITLRLALRHSDLSSFTWLAEKLPSLAITAIERKLPHSGVILKTVIRCARTPAWRLHSDPSGITD